MRSISLSVSQMVALNWVQKQIAAMIGNAIAESTFLKFVLRLHQSFSAGEKTAIKEILEASSIHVDETSFRVQQKNHWIHVYSSGEQP